MDLYDSLRQNYLTQGLSEEEVREIASIARSQTYADGEALMRASDPGTDFMIILDGKARILTRAGDKIAEIGPGSVVGEVALLDNGPRSATVLSVGKTVAAVIPAEELRALMSARPNIELHILRRLSKVLCARLRRDTAHLERSLFLLG